MAITIQSNPAAYSNVHGDLIYTVAEVAHTADPVTYSNYKFVGDVYIGGNLIARIKVVPNPVTNIGIFNVGPVVRSYIATTFNPSPAAIVAQKMGDGEFSVAVTMKFGEEYAYTTYTNLTTDSERVFYNNYQNRGDASLSVLADKVLSSRPYSTPVKRNAAFNLVPFLPSDTDQFTVTIKTYDFGGTLQNTYNHNITPDSANQLHILNLSKTAINASSPGLINDSIDYFTALFTTPNISDDVTYKFDLTCESIYEIFTLHFLNKYGGFESKDFAKVSRKTLNIERKDFGKLPYTVDSSGQVAYKNSNNVYNESRSVYSVQMREKMVLNTDNLPDGDFTWLGELVNSPMVFIEMSDGFYPVVITDNNYEPKKYVNDELSNLVLNLEFGDQNNSQYR